MFKTNLIVLILLTSACSHRETSGPTPILSPEEALSKYIKEGNESTKHALCFKRKKDLLPLGYHLSDMKNPASVSKLFVTYWALARADFGPDYRYKTKFEFYKGDLYISGDLDPYLVPENIFLVIKKLNQAKIKKIKTIYIDNNFLYDWLDPKEDFKDLQKRLLQVFNTNKYDSQLVNLLISTKNTKLEMRVKKIVLKNEFGKLPKSSLKFTHYSNKLVKILHQMNRYSTNFIAEYIFKKLGPKYDMEKYISETLLIPVEQMHFESGSGLYGNRVTCAATLQLIDGLFNQLRTLQLRPEELIAVNCEPSSTLRRRSCNDQFKHTFWAKSGYVGTSSTLAGVINEKDGETSFAIFTDLNPKRYEDYPEARVIQDKMMNEVFIPGQKIPNNFPSYSPIQDAEIK